MENPGLASFTYEKLFFDKKSFWGDATNRASFARIYIYGRRGHSFFIWADGAGNMRLRDSEVQRLPPEADLRQRMADLFLIKATLRRGSGQATTTRETENGLEDGLAKPKPFAVL